MDAFQVIVVVLSVLLGIFLVLAILVTVLVWKLIKSLRLVVAKGEQFVDTAGELGATLRRNAGAAALVKLLVSFIAKASKSKK